jgi:hypothetical protein
MKVTVPAIARVYYQTPADPDERMIYWSDVDGRGQERDKALPAYIARFRGCPPADVTILRIEEDP